MSQLPPDKLAETIELWHLVQEKRSAAEILLTAGLFNDSLSRSYYSAFHAVTLLFFLQDQSFASHKQAIGNFNRIFIHGGIFPQELARNLEALFEARQTGDYDYHVHFDRDEALEGIAKLDTILTAIRQHVADQFGIALL